MFSSYRLKVAVISLVALQAGLCPTYAQRNQRMMESEVNTGSPPGLIKKVEPEFPYYVVLRHVSGSGLFRLTINGKTGEVDEVKILRRTGYKILDELAVKGLLQWRFQPGTRGPFEVPVEFWVHGSGRILHYGDVG
jgi:TonB family protein